MFYLSRKECISMRGRSSALRPNAKSQPTEYNYKQLLDAIFVFAMREYKCATDCVHDRKESIPRGRAIRICEEIRHWFRKRERPHGNLRKVKWNEVMLLCASANRISPSQFARRSIDFLDRLDQGTHIVDIHGFRD